MVFKTFKRAKTFVDKTIMFKRYITVATEFGRRK